MSAATGGSASAHSVDTDFTGENVRSYPPTAAGGGRDQRASAEASGVSPLTGVVVAV